MSPVTFYANEAADKADDRHFYVGWHIGVNEGVEWPAKVGLGSGIALDGKLNTNAKIHGGVQFGYQYDHARLEVELQHGGLNVRDFSLGLVSGGGQRSINYSTLQVNGHRRFDITKKLGISLGAGAGLARASFPKIETGTNCNCMTGFSKTGFAYQFRAGLEYEVSERVQIVGHYNRLFLPAFENGSSLTTRYGKVNFGVTSIGLRIKF